MALFSFSQQHARNAAGRDAQGGGKKNNGEPQLQNKWPHFLAASVSLQFYSPSIRPLPISPFTAHRLFACAGWDLYDGRKAAELGRSRL
jgi:hypothetical protein